MDRSHVLEGVVRAWMETVLPGQVVLADRAVELAANSYVETDSIQAACQQVSEVVDSWVLHPATQGSGDHALVRLAS